MGHSMSSAEQSSDYKTDSVDTTSDFSAEKECPLPPISSRENEIPSVESYEDRIDNALKTKEYNHWESEEQREQNRRLIDNYDEKKIAVDRTTLLTQKAILTEYRQFFDSDNVKRMSSEVGSNKTEIYNESTFGAEKAPKSENGYVVVGTRDMLDGKICIKDSDDIELLKHTATHETMHDLSFQSADQTINHRQEQDGIHTVSVARICSGIEQLERTSYTSPEGTTSIREMTQNCYLNEGITEMYTIEAMQERGENPGFASYTNERAWALELRDHLGEDLVANAYFGGRVDVLEDRFNSMSDIPNAWNQLNENIDAFHHAITDKKRNECSKNIYNIFLSLNDGYVLERKRGL